MKHFVKLFSKITIEHLWVLVVLVGIFVFVNTHPIRPNDFWFHLALGRDFLANRQIPVVDQYSFTRMGQEYLSTYTFWLSEFVMYLVYKIGGAVGTVIFTSLLITSIYSILGWLAIKTSNNWRASAVGLIFGFALGFGNWNVRPQIFAYLWMVGLLFSIYKIQTTQNRKWLIAFPAIMVFWVNMHGSYPLGLAVLGCWFADVVWQAWHNRRPGEKIHLSQVGLAFWGLILGTMACLINPRGLGAIKYLTTMTGSNILKNFVLEWLPPSFDTLEGAVFLVGLLISAMILAVSRRRPTVFQVLLFLLFGALGLKYIRGAVWFGIIMVQPVAEALAPSLPGTSTSTTNPTARRMNMILTSFLALLAFFSLPWFKQYWPVLPEKAGLISYDTPVAATNFLLENHPEGYIFNDMAYGSYLIWAAQPDYKVFVDSRIELYSDDIWMDYLAITNAQPDWEELLDKYKVNTLMIGVKDQAPLVDAVKASSAWQEVYMDPVAVVFTRR